ncbi:uncharacterized protein A1O9_11953 [Exophiala aquamarina CBS 119918]|uniref:AMP-binding enzyme C-terminal domain-containing protein n=1 Tax=Exophiala aquamarina CBS 119918 TaxID=1182545 RepID=A0A072NY39_9EURO|nr:uncharacterized protein A1O9_11953 [Exophiala aquamarina CBS 119918]KEF51963.1 hypothetical protein A1O9_11953 [Exophiala aquamarina CBS 119918]
MPLDSWQDVPDGSVGKASMEVELKIAGLVDEGEGELSVQNFCLHIERQILGLPYVNEAMVVGVPDNEFGQRVAAVVTLRKDSSSTSTRPNLDGLRQDLRSGLAGYKLPTLLRVVEGELLKNATGKLVKKVLGPLYFPENDQQDVNARVWNPRRQKRAGLCKT